MFVDQCEGYYPGSQACNRLKDVGALVLYSVVSVVVY